MNGNYSDFLDNRIIRIAVLGVLGILALFLLAQTISAAQNLGRPGTPATDTITVHGDGQATAAPDVARVMYTVEHTAATVALAQSQTVEQANRVLDFVKGQGIKEKDIRTLSYNINPQYSYPSPCPPGALCPVDARSPRITGYQVSQTVEVTVRDLDTVGSFMGGLGNLQVQNVSGPNFALDDPESGYNAARADAIQKARARADVLSGQLGVRLGKIVNFSESAGGYPPYPMAYGKGGAAESRDAVANPVLPAGENTYNASVSITYEIR
jgi:uncharacterized protein